MKLKVFEQKKEQEREVFLRLVKEGDDIQLNAVDEKGGSVYHGYLLRIKKDGTIYRHDNVNPALGFQLDSDGRIKIEGEE
jgi:hypothetical protein